MSFVWNDSVKDCQGLFLVVVVVLTCVTNVSLNDREYITI